jgi:hypothetical protein
MSRAWLPMFLKSVAPADPASTVLSELAARLGVSVSYLMAEDIFSPETSIAPPPRALDKETIDLLKRIRETGSPTEKQLLELAYRPNAMHLFAAWLENGKVLRGFEQLLPYCDILDAPTPESPVPKVVHVGAYGLSAGSLESTDPQELQKFIERLDNDALEDLGKEMFTVVQTGQIGIADPTRTVATARGPKDLKFIRLQLRVKTPEGRHQIINYSDLVPERYGGGRLPQIVPQSASDRASEPAPAKGRGRRK